jgi:hypothetical protein
MGVGVLRTTTQWNGKTLETLISVCGMKAGTATEGRVRLRPRQECCALAAYATITVETPMMTAFLVMAIDPAKERWRIEDLSAHVGHVIGNVGIGGAPHDNMLIAKRCSSYDCSGFGRLTPWDHPCR